MAHGFDLCIDFKVRLIVESQAVVIKHAVDLAGLHDDLDAVALLLFVDCQLLEEDWVLAVHDILIWLQN